MSWPFNWMPLAVPPAARPCTWLTSSNIDMRTVSKNRNPDLNAAGSFASGTSLHLTAVQPTVRNYQFRNSACSSCEQARGSGDALIDEHSRH